MSEGPVTDQPEVVGSTEAAAAANRGFTDLSIVNHDNILSVAEALPPLPSSVVELAAVVANGDSGIDDVVAVLRHDPGLVTSVLSEANSAASASAVEITTIEAAIVRLGLARILALACVNTIGPQAVRALQAYRLPTGALWRHSVISSYIAEVVFRSLRGAVGPHVVTSTLLHDIGRVVLNGSLDRDQLAAITLHLPVEDAERELLGVDHAEVGAALLQMWGLPDVIVSAVGSHHRPRFVRDDPATAVSLASHIANDIQPGPVAFRESSTIQTLATSLDVDLEEIVEKSRTLLVQVGAIDPE